MKRWFILSAAVLTALLLGQNMQTVTVSFLFWNASMPQIALLALTFLVGLLMGLLLPGFGSAAQPTKDDPLGDAGGRTYA